MVKMRLPRGIFEDMMSNMKEQDTEGLSWIDGVVQPTKKTSSADQFNFVVKRPMAVDRLFSLETADLRGVHMKEGKGAWMRGKGCAVLKLGDKPESGAKASVLSMVGGNLILKYSEPRNHRWWPTLTLKFWVLTVDHHGNILWPTKWEPNSEKLLAELARRKVEFFKQNKDLYPIRDDFSVTPGISSALVTKENNPAIPPPTAPLLLQ